MSQMFQLSSTLALAGWLVLLVSPLIPTLSNRIAGYVIPGCLCLIYTLLSSVFIGETEGGFDSLENVARLFENRQVLLAGWVHYLAFDLFIGNWQVVKARESGMPFWLVLPCLPLTLYFGPVGLLLFLLLWGAFSAMGKYRDNRREAL